MTMQWLGLATNAANATLPERVRLEIARRQDRSEQIISAIQLLVVVTFGILFVISPRPTIRPLGWDLVPWALALYLGFTLLRLAASLRIRLPGWLLAVSILLDMTLLMALIWSFHRTYWQPPSFYLKSPTLLYVFIFISLRALRFEARYVLLAGMTAVAGWSALVVYAVREAGPDGVTRDYVESMTRNSILLGAEFDKLISISLVTLVLALAVVRARRALVAAAVEGSAKRELARFFDPDVARQITSAEQEISAGQGVHREAAVLFLDIRGFTPMAAAMPPDDVMKLLSEYQGVVVPAILAAGGAIDKFLGDGILATFGAAIPSPTHAADALRAVDGTLAAVDAWNTARAAKGQGSLAVNAAVASGLVVFGAVGDPHRLEVTVIGDAVNLAAKLEKHTKVEAARALTTAATFERARRQGFRPQAPVETRLRRSVAGVAEPLDLVVLAAA